LLKFKLMKKLFSFIFFVTFFLSCAQEYEFINQVITPFEKKNPIPLDTIFLRNKFLLPGKGFQSIESFNKPNLKSLWEPIPYVHTPPVELFLHNFDTGYIQSELQKIQNDSLINIEQLNKYFYLCSDEFVKNNPRNKYISISKPIFNRNKDWCFIVKSHFIPYVQVGGGIMEIYVKVNKVWVLYHTLTLWFS